MTKRSRDLLAPLDFHSDTEQENTRARLKKAQNDLDSILEVDAQQVDKEIISERFRKAVIESKGLKAFEKIAASYAPAQFLLMQTLRSEHRGNSITRLLSSDSLLISADKAGNIIKWNMHLGVWKKQHLFKTMNSVQSLAISSDAGYLLSGHVDGSILAWSLQTNKRLGVLGPNGHRDAVTSIAFQPASLTAFSCSADRTVKIWSIEQLAYIDTLFGHQDSASSIAVANQDKCVTVGSRDRTVRLWKITEETQLVFRMSETDGGSLDEVVCVDKYFVSGADSGLLSLWSASRKKPVHNVRGHLAPISCLYSPHMTDLIITGSSDGFVRFWQIGEDVIEKVCELPIPGFITGIALVDDQLAVAVAPEGRFGRWQVDSSIKSSILIFSISNTQK